MATVEDPRGSTPTASAEPEADRIRTVFEVRDRTSRSPSMRAAGSILARERMAALIRITAEEAVERPHPSILDVGCGHGADLAEWRALGWPAERLAGVDLVASRVAEARHAVPGADVRVVAGATLPFGDSSFDVATAATVFSSILDASVRRALFDEMTRILRPGGLLIIYDFVIRKPRNRDVVAMSLSKLSQLAGRPPDRSERLAPLIYLVAVASRLGLRAERVAMRLAPRTHRISAWRIDRAP